jgi:rhamnosyl/mannosyltransferase
LRILHFFKTYLPDSRGGTEQFIYQLAHGSVIRGIDVDVLSLSSDVTNDSRDFDNHVSHRVRKDLEIASTGFSIQAFSRFSELARRADVVHYHYPWPFADVVHFATSIKKPSVLTYHSDIVRQVWLMRLYRPLMTRFLRSVNRIVATSPNYLATSDVLAHYRGKTEIIPIGLDRSTYPRPTSASLESWRARIGERFFLFVGVLRYYKGLHILLEALQGTNYQVVIMTYLVIIFEKGRIHARVAGPVVPTHKGDLLYFRRGLEADFGGHFAVVAFPL